MTAIFFYGSLRNRELLEVVLGRGIDPADLVPARVVDHATRRVAGESYPVLLPQTGAVSEGVILDGATDTDLQRLTYYEEAEYGLAPLTVETAEGTRDVRYFRGTEKPSALAEQWDYSAWESGHLAVAIETAREYMHHITTLPVAEVDTIWPGVKIRGQQRARALADEPRLGSIRTAFTPGDVTCHGMTRAYTSFLAVQELRLSHRRFDGGRTAELDRSVVLWGDAVTILPYDPVRDRVLLIEQFRCGPMARGDANPWCIEVVAGRIDRDESLEDTARREAREEAGIEIGRIVPAGSYYPTPGLAAEHMTGFVGEADLPGTGGLHGLDHEHEDIRTIVLGFDEAMAQIEAGAVNTGPALLSLLWLAAQRDRLRREWAPE